MLDPAGEVATVAVLAISIVAGLVTLELTVAAARPERTVGVAATVCAVVHTVIARFSESAVDHAVPAAGRSNAARRAGAR